MTVLHLFIVDIVCFIWILYSRLCVRARAHTCTWIQHSMLCVCVCARTHVHVDATQYAVYEYEQYAMNGYCIFCCCMRTAKFALYGYSSFLKYCVQFHFIVCYVYCCVWSEGDSLQL